MVYTEALESPRLSRRKTLNLSQGKGATPLATKEQRCKRGTVDARGAGGIEMILAVLGPVSLACGFGTNGLSLKEKIHAEHCHRPKVFLGILGGSYGGDWTSCIAGVRPLIQKSPQKHLDCCTRLSAAGVRAGYHRCGAV